MKRLTIILPLLLYVYITDAYGQTRTPVLLGVQPGVTIEPFYEEGELDVNVFPLLIEVPIGTRTNIKLAPLVNYHIGGEENGVSDVGLYTVFPIFIKERENREDVPFGFYVGPVLGFGRNLLNDHYTTTLAVEPGYMFEAKKSFTITLGVQFGASHFAYDNQPNKWVFHWGPKITFGFWTRRTKNDAEALGQ
jgi:hypothetical protein